MLAVTTAEDPKTPPPPLAGTNGSARPDKQVGQSLSLVWLNEAVKESRAFLQAQPGYSKIEEVIRTVMGEDERESFDPRSAISQTRTNRIAKLAEDMTALMVDIKPFWDYSVDNRRFEQHAQNYGKLSTFWYQRRNIALRLADAIKYWYAAGTGYVHLYWDPEIGDINCTSEDPRNVLPIRPVNYDSLESCLGVVVERKVPTNYIESRYGIHVSADSDGSALTWMAKMRDTAADIVSPIWKFAKGGAQDRMLPRIPTVSLFTCYIKDDSTNKTGKTLELGEFVTKPDGSREPANNWSYLVKPGEPLYPNRRCIVWCGNTRLYDGPSFYWHAGFPILKLTLNPYPWSWFGKAPAWDLLKLQTALNRLLRVVDDHAAQVAQPGSFHDKNSVSRSEYNSFDTRRAGYKIYQNPLAGKGIQVINPPPLDVAIFEHIKWIIEEMDLLAGKTDLSQMMRLNQLPSNSTVESILNSMTPALRFRSQILEAFIRDFAMQLAYNFSQFYTIPMRVAVAGPGSLTADDFDFDPGTMIPDFVHVDDFDSMGNVTEEASIRGPLPRFQRAQEFLRRFIFKISPGSLLNAAQVEQKLIYLQLARAGWMDIYTLWEILGIPNIGTLPDNVRTIPDRLKWQEAQGLSGNVNPVGRKATGQELPRLKTSESG